MEVDASKKRKIDHILSMSEIVYQPNKKIKIEMDVRYQTNEQLPKELMVEIFSKLHKDIRIVCSETCKYWHECESATSNGWILVGSDLIPTLEDNLARQAIEKKEYALPAAWNCDAERNTGKRSRSCKICFSFAADPELKITKDYELSADRKIGLVVKSIVHATGNAYDILPDIMSFTNTFSSSNQTKQWKVKVTLLPRSSAANFNVEYYYNIFELENAVHEGNVEWESVLVKHAVGAEIEEYMDTFKWAPIIESMEKAMLSKVVPKIDAPPGLKNGFKFHPYQLDAISWMSDVEKNSGDVKYCPLVPWRKSRANVLVDLHEEKFVAMDQRDKYTRSIKSKGAILADVSGLGKTLEVIGLVMLMPKQELSEFGDNALYNTGATLVICLENMVQRWVDEISGLTDLKVTSISSLEDLKKATYADFVASAFVIISSSVVADTNYFLLCCGKKKLKRNAAGFKDRAKHLQKALAQVKAGDGLQAKQPLLEHFNFRRIVVDDAHQILAHSPTSSIICDLNKEFGWLVTSLTTFMVDFILVAQKFFEIPKHVSRSKAGSIADKYEKFLKERLLYESLVWRNTVRSVNKKATVPNFEKSIVEISFHPIEDLLYKESDEKDHQIKVCNGIFKFETLDTAIQESIDILNKRIENEETKIANIKWPRNRNGDTPYGELMMKSNYEDNIKRYKQTMAEWMAVDPVLKGKEIGSADELAHLTLVNKYGSKLAYIIQWTKQYIQTGSSNRVVLFSQNEEYMTKILTILSENGVEAVRIQGGVVQASSIIKKITSEGIQVVLSRLIDATDLTPLAPQYILMLDVPNEDAIAEEKFALGRIYNPESDVKVQLVRFIVNTTVEEIEWRRTMNQQQSTF